MFFYQPNFSNFFLTYFSNMFFLTGSKARDLSNNISWLDVLEGVNSVVSAIRNKVRKLFCGFFCCIFFVCIFVAFLTVPIIAEERSRGVVFR